MKVRLYTILRKDIDKLINIIYKKAVEEVVDLGSVASIFELGFRRITIILRWFYFAIFVTILTYIISIGKVIEAKFIIIFKYIQKFGKLILDIILNLTGPLSQDVINNIWLLYILILILLSLLISIKIIKYIILNIKERNLERNLFKQELINKLKEQDELIKKQIIEFKNEIEIKGAIREIKINGVFYNIDITKLK